MTFPAKRPTASCIDHRYFNWSYNAHIVRCKAVSIIYNAIKHVFRVVKLAIPTSGHLNLAEDCEGRHLMSSGWVASSWTEKSARFKFSDCPDLGSTKDTNVRADWMARHLVYCSNRYRYWTLTYASKHPRNDIAGCMTDFNLGPLSSDHNANFACYNANLRLHHDIVAFQPTARCLQRDHLQLYREPGITGMACLTLIPTRARSISVIFSDQLPIIIVYTTSLSRSNIFIQWLESLVIRFYEEGRIADFNRLSAGFGWQSWRCVVCLPDPTTFTGRSCPLLGKLVIECSWTLSVSVLTLHTCRSWCESEMEC